MYTDAQQSQTGTHPQIKNVKTHLFRWRFHNKMKYNHTITWIQKTSTPKSTHDRSKHNRNEHPFQHHCQYYALAASILAIATILPSTIPIQIGGAWSMEALQTAPFRCYIPSQDGCGNWSEWEGGERWWVTLCIVFLVTFLSYVGLDTFNSLTTFWW